MLKINLIPDNPHYEFTCPLDGNSYKFEIRWNETSSAWYMSITGITIDVQIRGIKLISGVDLLKPFPIPELGMMYIIDSQEQNQDPDYDGLGSRFLLLYEPLGE
jgi:hypothetical protein